MVSLATSLGRNTGRHKSAHQKAQNGQKELDRLANLLKKTSAESTAAFAKRNRKGSNKYVVVLELENDPARLARCKTQDTSMLKEGQRNEQCEGHKFQTLWKTKAGKNK